MSDLGSEIRRLRLKAGLTQKQLGVMMGMRPSYAPAAISKWENGKRNPSGTMWKLLQLTLNNALQGKEENNA